MDGFAGVGGLFDAAGAGANGAAPVPATGRPAAGLAAILADGAACEELRRRVEETTDSLRAIAAGCGVPQAALSRAVKDHGWRRPPGAPVSHGGVAKGSRMLARDLSDAARVQGRLLRAVDRQTLKIEQKLGRAGATIEEKDARVLVHLARTLATLMALEGGHGAGQEPERRSRDERDEELARRIAAWAEGEDE